MLRDSKQTPQHKESEYLIFFRSSCLVAPILQKSVSNDYKIITKELMNI